MSAATPAAPAAVAEDGVSGDEVVLDVDDELMFEENNIRSVTI